MPQDVVTADATSDAQARVTRDPSAPAGPPSIFPCLSYRDAPAAIEWLGRAFGFEKVCAYPGPDGTIAHAELRLDNGMIMLGSPKGERPSWPLDGGPDDWDQSIYIVLDDVDAHYARAKAAGARIVRELIDTDYGSRDYSARDPEGYLWSFGTYQPFATAHADSAERA